MNIEINKPAGNSGLIMVFDGLIDPNVCSDFITKLKNFWHAAHDGRTLGGVNFITKTTEDLHVSECAFEEQELKWDWQLAEMEMAFTAGLTSAISLYKQNYRHLDHWIEIQDTGFQVQKYYQNFGYYRPHVDSFPGSAVGNRVLGAVVYLNNIEYGGETNFPIHNVMVKPKAGRIALFPASWTHLHESCVAITDDKWIISTFIINSEKNKEVVVSSQNEEKNHDEHHDHDHDHDHVHDNIKNNDF